MENKKEQGVILLKKTEKISAALYLVTDLLEKDEPLKMSLREKSISILSNVQKVSENDITDIYVLYTATVSSIKAIMSLITITKLSGTISQMNADLLIGAYQTLLTVFESKLPQLSEDIFIVQGEETLVDSAKTTKLFFLEEETREIKDGTTTPKRKEGTLGESARAVEKFPVADRLKRREDEFYKGQKETIALSSFQQRKVSRKEQILMLFSRGVDMGIRDITARIKGCSDKTIQRELNTLVFEKKLERIGEKRWSRYMLR
jgi:hypothetical protein